MAVATDSETVDTYYSHFGSYNNQLNVCVCQHRFTGSLFIDPSALSATNSYRDMLV